MGFEQSRFPDRSLESAPVLGFLSSGEKVFDRPNSHIHDDIDIATLTEALGNIDATGKDFIVESVDLGRTIGKTQCIETSENDEIVYAQREGRFGLTRFVKNREKKDTSIVTMILKKTPEGFVAITAFAGPKAEREPWDRNLVDPNEKAESESFWQNHALVWDGKNIIPGSEKKSNNLY